MEPRVKGGRGRSVPQKLMHSEFKLNILTVIFSGATERRRKLEKLEI